MLSKLLMIPLLLWVLSKMFQIKIYSIPLKKVILIAKLVWVLITIGVMLLREKSIHCGHYTLIMPKELLVFLEVSSKKLIAIFSPLTKMLLPAFGLILCLNCIMQRMMMTKDILFKLMSNSSVI